jgi:hypothetical protein
MADSHYLPFPHSYHINTLLFSIIGGKKPSTLKYVAFLTREICVGLNQFLELSPGTTGGLKVKTAL